MKTEEILSTGIDIGTSTTQLIISRLLLEASEGFGKIPEMKIAKREVVYKSDIYFTPLFSNEEINAEGVLKIISDEYKKAGITPDMLKTGAVIITGESLKKKNAGEVSEAVSSVSGNFTCAVCGPDLEGILAGKGSGAAALSREKACRVMNIDIGGGTTNICLFDNGQVIDTACLDTGGRLVRIKGGRISYVADVLKGMTSLKEGDAADISELKRLCAAMAVLTAQAAGLSEKTELLERVKTNKLLKEESKADIFMFSGGVGSLIKEETDVFAYGDIGVLLAREIAALKAFKGKDVRVSSAARRATVIGAGNYSLSLSGSTVEYTKGILPLKNIPVAKVNFSFEKDAKGLFAEVKEALSLLCGQFPAALYMEGFKCPSFVQIEETAGELCRAADELIPEGEPLIVIFKNDMAKAAGQAVRRRLKGSRPFICIDGIGCESGDHIDLAEPIAGAKAVPVTVKTLVFTS